VFLLKILLLINFKLGVKFMAHKKGAGSTKNGRDSNAKRLGVKRFGGEKVTGRKYFNSSKRYEI
jgi:hypothetical protein